MNEAQYFPSTNLPNANFIARDSVYYAQMFTTEVFEAVDRLELFSESGRVVPELNRKEIQTIKDNKVNHGI
ncbi:MAG: hypothetical protein FJ264_11855 [Planctomycetes bacterium]|nr:hypothetical protein [Planctomycetota bacterium]